MRPPGRTKAPDQPAQHPGAPGFPPRFDPQRRRALAWAAAWPWAAAAAPAHEWRPWPARKPVPPLDLQPLDGPPWRLAAQRGQVLLVNFWASWCEPCRAELPSLADLAYFEAGSGLVAVAVNYRESPATIRRFRASLPPDPPPPTVLLDPDGQAARAWTPLIFPSTVLITRQGRPAGVVVGEIDWTGPAAQALLAPLLAAR